MHSPVTLLGKTWTHREGTGLRTRSGCGLWRSGIGWCWVGLVLVGGLQPAAAEPSGEHVAERLCAMYERVQTVSCEIRKTTRSPEGTVRWLSRVLYKRPDRIHVENVTPVRRRILADGRTLYYHQAGQRRGFARPIVRLDSRWLDALRNVPGSPMEHLVHLRGLPELSAQFATSSLPRVAYQTSRHYVVLTCDETGRLAQVEFFDPSDRSRRTAIYEYAEYVEAVPGCWFPLRHRGEVLLPDGGRIEETRFVSNLAVNQPLAESLFVPDLYFQGVEFTEAFESPEGPP